MDCLFKMKIEDRFLILQDKCMLIQPKILKRFQVTITDINKTLLSLYFRIQARSWLLKVDLTKYLTVIIVRVQGTQWIDTCQQIHGYPSHFQSKGKTKGLTAVVQGQCHDDNMNDDVTHVCQRSSSTTWIKDRFASRLVASHLHPTQMMLSHLTQIVDPLLVLGMGIFFFCCMLGFYILITQVNGAIQHIQVELTKVQ